MSTIAIILSILFGSVSSSTTVDVKSNKVVSETKISKDNTSSIVIVDIMTP